MITVRSIFAEAEGPGAKRAVFELGRSLRGSKASQMTIPKSAIDCDYEL